MRSSLSATLGPTEPSRPLDGLSVMAISPPLELDARESVFLAADDDPKALRAASPSPPARPSDPSCDFGFVP